MSERTLLSYVAITRSNINLERCTALLTSESLVARCDGEGALLHSQLVKLGELWRDSSRGRL